MVTIFIDGQDDNKKVQEWIDKLNIRIRSYNTDLKQALLLCRNDFILYGKCVMDITDGNIRRVAPTELRQIELNCHQCGNHMSATVLVGKPYVLHCYQCGSKHTEETELVKEEYVKPLLGDDNA